MRVTQVAYPTRPPQNSRICRRKRDEASENKIKINVDLSSISHDSNVCDPPPKTRTLSWLIFHANKSRIYVVWLKRVIHYMGVQKTRSSMPYREKFTGWAAHRGGDGGLGALLLAPDDQLLRWWEQTQTATCLYKNFCPGYIPDYLGRLRNKCYVHRVMVKPGSSLHFQLLARASVTHLLWDLM